MYKKESDQTIGVLGYNTPFRTNYDIELNEKFDTLNLSKESYLYQLPTSYDCFYNQCIPSYNNTGFYENESSCYNDGCGIYNYIPQSLYYNTRYIRGGRRGWNHRGKGGGGGGRGGGGRGR